MMKFYILMLLFCFSIFTFSQEKNIIKNLELQINNADKMKRLVLMDSLSNYIAYKTDFKTDSIIRETIKYAKEFDSIDIIVRQTANILYFLNYKSGSLKEAKQFIEEAKILLPKLKNKKSLTKFYCEAATLLL